MLVSFISPWAKQSSMKSLRPSKPCDLHKSSHRLTLQLNLKHSLSFFAQAATQRSILQSHVGRRWLRQLNSGSFIVGSLLPSPGGHQSLQHCLNGAPCDSKVLSDRPNWSASSRQSALHLQSTISLALSQTKIGAAVMDVDGYFSGWWVEQTLAQQSTKALQLVHCDCLQASNSS